MKLHELARGVYAVISEVDSPTGDSNFGIITGNDGTLIIDGDIRRGEQIKGLVEEISAEPLLYVINTHEHFDHTSFNSVLSREHTWIMASEACRNALVTAGREEFKNRIYQNNALKDKYGDKELRLPNLITDGQINLCFNGYHLEISCVGEAHTPGDLVVYLHEEQILFAGDLLFNNCHPVTRDANIRNWMQVLETISRRPIITTVPGHGSLTRGKGNLEKMKEYFHTLISEIKTFKQQGLSLEEIEEQLQLPEYDDWGKKEWFSKNIKNIYQGCLEII